MFDKVLSQRILPLIPELIPGIDQVVLIHYQQDNNAFSGYQLKQESSGYMTEKIRIDFGAPFFREYAQSTQTYQWFSREQMPFEVKTTGKVQLTIFNEIKNSILLIKIRSQTGVETDLFFIYLHENLSNFLLDKVTEPFSAQHKKMVGYLIYNSIKTLYQLIQSNDKLTVTFYEQIQLIVRERDQLQDQLEQISVKERSEVLKLAQHYLTRLTIEQGVKASLTDSARVKLRHFKGELSQIEAIVREALGFAGAISSPSGTSPLLIADYHIRFPEPSSQIVREEGYEGLPQRLVKTHLLLDRLEHAAAGIKQRKGSLTSANVGKEFPSPISAPAITDALRKHKKRIIQLFDQFPDKWEIIRHEFRPVQNMMNSLGDQEPLSA